MNNTLDGKYQDLLRDILANGTKKADRTGVGTISVSGRMLKHDMSEGFPILTTKKVSLKNIAVELEGFLKGITSKAWYKGKGCNIWNEWSNTDLMPKGLSDDERKAWQMECDDLGPFYGYQWRNFNSQGYDQIQVLLDTLKTNPTSRRMVVTAWNPPQLQSMALDPCHFAFQVIVRGEYLDLVWTQRSVDSFLGMSYDLSSYGILLTLLSKQFGYKPGVLTGMFGDTHIYLNHIDQVNEQLSRDPFPLPTLEVSESFKTVLDFDSQTHIKLVGYQSHSAIRAPVAI